MKDPLRPILSSPRFYLQVLTSCSSCPLSIPEGPSELGQTPLKFRVTFEPRKPSSPSRLTLCPAGRAGGHCPDTGVTSTHLTPAQSAPSLHTSAWFRVPTVNLVLSGQASLRDPLGPQGLCLLSGPLPPVWTLLLLPPSLPPFPPGMVTS